MPNEGPWCLMCDATGFLRDAVCTYCQGEGRVQSMDQWIDAGKPRTQRSLAERRRDEVRLQLHGDSGRDRL